MNGVLLSPFPYQDANRLVQIYESEPELPSVPVNMADYLDWTKSQHSFDALAMYNNYNVANLTGAGEPDRVRILRAESALLPLLGIAPELGRNFLPEENQPGRDREAILTHALWKSRFAGDPNVIGRSIALDSEALTVVGVLPADFQLGRPVDVLTPLSMDLTKGQNQRGNHGNQVMGKLRPGVSVKAAGAELQTLAAAIEKQFPKQNAGVGAVVVSLRDQVLGNIRPALFILLGAVGCVLLIACANVANLLLARATARSKEMAVRVALGAGRARILRQLLTESVLLSTLAAVLGLLLAMWTTDLVRSLKISSIPRIDRIVIDWHVLLFTAAIAIATGIVFGLAPAAQISKVSLAVAMQRAGGRNTAGGQQRLRQVLVATEAGLAALLLIGSGLLLRSFVRVTGIDPGFRSDHVITLNLLLPDASYGKPGQVQRFTERVLQQVRSTPGIRSATFASALPLTGGSNGTITVEGKPRGQNVWDSPLVEFARITPAFFQTLGIPFLAGRDFNERDRKDSPQVAIVNQTLARRFWPNENPIGKHIGYFNEPVVWKEVVGVVGDTPQFGLERKPIPEMYTPLLQEEVQYLTLAARTDSDPLTFGTTLTSIVRSIDPSEPTFNIRTMDQVVGTGLQLRTFNTSLLVVFGLIATILASVGIYGVVSYSVAQRSPEIGIRMALGAARSDVLGMIIFQGMAPVVAGAALGIAASFGTARLLSTLLYGIATTDAITYVSVAALLIAVATAASYIPARRAASINAITILRHE